MQLVQFNGGLSTRLSPHLIEANEAVIYTNIDNKQGALTPIKGNTNLTTAIGKSLYNFKNTWVSSSDDRDYVEYQEKLYYSDGVNKPEKTSDGVNWYNLGITKPANKPTVAISGSGVLTGTYQYMYTYYNNTDGTESQPSEYSAELVTVSNGVNVTLVASIDTQVTHINLYRVGGNLVAPVRVVQLASTSTTYFDNIADIDVDGNALDSYTNAPAPSGLKYLTEAFSMFFGAIGDKVYFSEIGFPDYWNEFYFIDFPSDITGFGATQNGILVFTKYKTYLLSGTSPSTLSKYLLNGNQGCILHKSVQYVFNTLVWLSTDGICVSAGGEIQVVSRTKLDNLSIIPICSVVYDDVYYLAHTTGILVVDFRFGSIVFRSIATLVLGLHVYNAILYACISNVLYSIGTSSTSETLVWKSPRLPDGSLSTIKNYKSIYTHSTGNLSIKVYIDDVLISTTSLSAGFTEVKLPQDKRLGYYIQFEVTGTGVLNEIEYKVEGRQNGK